MEKEIEEENVVEMTESLEGCLCEVRQHFRLRALGRRLERELKREGVDYGGLNYNKANWFSKW